MPVRLRALYHAAKPDVDILLNHRKATYTTLDKLEGVVRITPPADTHFDDIDIEFVGTSRTYVERLTTAAAISGRSEAFHQFLKLQQPGLHQYYPEDFVLKAGRTYEFPFVFVIPQHLLPRVCRHRVESARVREDHLQLPPSFGDRDRDDKADCLDDMVPEMASIRYGVFARISKNKLQGDEVVRATVASKAKRLRVIPATDEQPPLAITNDPEYTMRRERTIKKNVIAGKLGTLVMEAAQPASMRLRARNDEEQQPAVATIMLRFDPVDEKAPPPRLGSLASKLKVSTYFASTARSTFPAKAASLLDLSQGLHSEQLNLASRCVANVEWKKHEAGKDDMRQRRDSALSLYPVTSADIPSPSTSYKGKSYWTAKLVVPINLPTRKSFVPTFHSCLISRVYQLKLELGLHTAGLGGSVDLKLPLQISCEGSRGNNSPRRASVASNMEFVTDDEDVGAFFEARTRHVPDDQFVGRSRVGSVAPTAPAADDDAPPGYSPFISQYGGQRVPVF